MFTRRKKPRVKAKTVDAQYVGSEPTQINNEIDLVQAYNYYNYHFNNQDARRWVTEWLSKQHKSVQKWAKDYKLAHDNHTSMTMGAIAHMLNRNVVLPKHCLEFLVRRIQDVALTAAKYRKLAEKAEVTYIYPKVHENWVIIEAETMLDEYYQQEYPHIEPYKLPLRERNAKRKDVEAAVEFYDKLLLELGTKKGEGYEKLSKRQFNSYRRFVSLMLEQLNGYLREKTVTRKPRAPKIKSGDQIIKRLQFKATDAELNTVSINPLAILEAKVLYLYNTKYKMMTRLQALPAKALSVKGTTVINFDPKFSTRKKLRKPEAMLHAVLTMTDKMAEKALKKLSTKFLEVNGRVNTDTLILRAHK